MKSAVEKVAISLPPDLLQRAERLRRRTGESRSALVSRALARLIASEEHARRVAEYVEAYRRLPESPEEVAEARSLARRSLCAVAWDET